MTDEEFVELEKKYYDELHNREEIEKLVREKEEYAKIIDKINTAHSSPYESLSIFLEIQISYGDCEGRREIDRDTFDIDLTYDQVIAFITSEICHIDKSIADKRESLYKEQ